VFILPTWCHLRLWLVLYPNSILTSRTVYTVNKEILNSALDTIFLDTLVAEVIEYIVIFNTSWIF
jgi:hypothetical protein